MEPVRASTVSTATVPAASLLETWAISARLNGFLLNAIAPEHLVVTAPSGGRSVGKQFGHLHDVRLMWLRSANAELASGLEKADDRATADPEALHALLEGSAAAVATLLERTLGAGGRVKGFKPHATAFLGYLVAHESHHRSQIVIALKAAGHALPKTVTYGLWEWGVR